jgi:cell wall assembly regulator SMI1
MQATWERLHTWLSAKAPAGYGDLRPAASESAVQQAEHAMGLKLPDDLKASFRTHDGQGREPGLIGGEGWWLLPLHDVVETWNRWSAANPAYAGRVPVAWNGAGDYVFVNLDPDAQRPGGVMIQRADSTDPDPLANSFTAWLEAFADELEQGVLVYSEEYGGLAPADDVE